jgi:hypothetical protein
MQLKDRASFRWWFFYVFHNAIAHPCLIIGEIIDTIGFVLIKRRFGRVAAFCRGVRSFFDALHDKTIPDGDVKNRIRLSS